MTFPPVPIIIPSGGGSGGSSISQDGSEVAVVTDSYGNSSLQFKTMNDMAMIIDENQYVKIGTQGTTTSRLHVSDSMGKCLTLMNSLSFVYASLQIDNNGLSIITSNGTIKFGSSKLYLQNSNLYLSDQPVVCTAEQINYNNVTPGTSIASKSLITDSSNNIAGINSLSAASLIGTLQTGNQPNISSLSTINITGQLSLSGTQVTSTANELNYLHGITPGTISTNKAFVFDSTNNLIGINRISATTIAGTLETDNQSAITTVGTLTKLNTSGYIGIGTTSPSTNLEILDTTPTITLNNSTTIAQVSLISGNLQLISNNDIVLNANTRLQNHTLTGITTLSATSINGTLLTANQPNITSIGNLLSMISLGDAVIGQTSTAASTFRLTVNEQNGLLLYLKRSAILTCTFSINNLGNLIIFPSQSVIIQSGLVLNGTLTGVTDLTANRLYGEIQTAAQPNITTIGTLGSLAVTNGITASSVSASSLTGTLQTASQPNITTIGTLGSLAVTNGITASSVSASSLTGTLQTAIQDNITRIGTLTRLNTSAAIGIGKTSPVYAIDVDTASISTTLAIAMTDGTNTSLITTDTNGVSVNMSGAYFALGPSKSLLLNGGDIIGLTSLTVTNITGTLQTALQPNITTIGTLGSLAVTNGITASSVSASSLTGTLQTALQPNITTIGTLGSLAVTNGITASSVSASSLTGTLQTAIQDSITRTGTLTRLNTLSAVGIGKTSPTTAIDIDTSSISTLLAISMTDGTNSALISTDTTGITLNTSGDYINLGVNKSLKINNGSIIGLASLIVTDITGTIQTAAQPNITSVGTLDYVDTSYIGLGVIHGSTYRINVVDSTGLFTSFSNGVRTMTVGVINNDYTISTSNKRLALQTDNDLVMNGGTIIGLTSLSVTTLTGTLLTAAQPNITSIGSLDSLTVIGSIGTNGISSTAQISAPSVYINGGPLTVIGSASISTTLSMGVSFTLGTTTMTQLDLDNLIEAAYTPTLQGGTAGSVEANLALVPDVNKNIGTFNDLRATNLYGAVKDAYQPLITTLGTLNYLNVSGEMGIGTTTPTQKLEIVSVTGNCLRLTNSNTDKHADLLIDDNGNLSIIPSTTTKMDTLMIGNASANQIPMEVGYTAFTMTSPYAYRTNTGATGIVDPVVTPTSYNYSIRALGRILCTGSIDVMSDKRVKTNIQELTDDYCTAFVKYTTPVKYNRINGDPNENFGYIAQELMRAGFPELVNLIPDDDMIEEIDEDGYISPEGMAYNISYEHIIPILAKNQQRLMKENEELKNKIEYILRLLENKSS